MSNTVRILLALVVGLLLGIGAAALGSGWAEQGIAIAEPIGTLWLNALRMTIVPLVVSLLITSIAGAGEAARASRTAAKALIFFAVLLAISAVVGALLTPLLLQVWPTPAAAADALRGSFTTGQGATEVPGFAQFVRAIVPTNPIAAAAEDAILPLVAFTSIFAFALTRVSREAHERLTGFFRAVADVMLVIIGWVLAIAPLGVLALAYVLGARAGAAAFGALVHYVVVVSATGAVMWLLAYPVARFGARLPLREFSRAVAPAQAVAISTQSSLASLPAMLRSAETLRVSHEISGVVLPLAVALFRVTGPAMNVAVVVYVAHLLGLQLGPAQLAAAIVTAAITTFGTVSLPGQISFVTAIAPIAMAAGVPIEPLLLLVAVENVPDIMRTFGNVTMDVAATAAIARGHSGPTTSSP
jgi:proton glutamate symport protein